MRPRRAQRAGQLSGQASVRRQEPGPLSHCLLVRRERYRLARRSEHLPQVLIGSRAAPVCHDHPQAVPGGLHHDVAVPDPAAEELDHPGRERA